MDQLMDTSTILAELRSWPAEAKLRLIGEIWDELSAGDGNLELSEEIRAELDQRLAEHEANPADAVPWEQVSAEALNRAKR